MSKLFRVFLFLFVFTTFNREFRLFGFDPRYLTVILSILLLCSCLPKLSAKHNESKKEGSFTFSFSDLALFYGIAAISNLSWIWNGLPLNESQFISLVILNVSNVLFAGTFITFRNEIRREDVLSYSLISLFVMSFSMIWVYAGLNLPTFLHDNEIRVSSSGESFVNMFGQSIRVAGFAEDANYASLFSVIGFALCFVRYRPWTLVQIAAVSVFFVSFAISFSRTVAIGVLMALLMLLARGIISRSWKSFSWVSSIAIAMLGLVVLANVPVLQDLSTTSTRFILWSIAQSVFLDNPILGGGLSSVRSAIDCAYNGLWYVQCHSTYWQILAEHGIVALGLFIVVIARRYSICRKWWQVFILTQFAALCLTSELMYQQVFIYMLVLMPLLFLLDGSIEKVGESQSIPAKDCNRQVRRGV